MAYLHDNQTGQLAGTETTPGAKRSNAGPATLTSDKRTVHESSPEEGVRTGDGAGLLRAPELALSYFGLLAADVCGLLAAYVFYDAIQPYTTAYTIFTLPCLAHTADTPAWSEILRNYAPFVYRTYYSSNDCYTGVYMGYDGSVDYMGALRKAQTGLSDIDHYADIVLGPSAHLNEPAWNYAHTHRFDRRLAHYRELITAHLRTYMQPATTLSDDETNLLTRIFALRGFFGVLPPELDHILRSFGGGAVGKLSLSFCRYIIDTYLRDSLLSYPFVGFGPQQIQQSSDVKRAYYWTRTYIKAAAHTDDPLIFTAVMSELGCTRVDIVSCLRKYSVYGDALNLGVLVRADAAALITYFDMWNEVIPTLSVRSLSLTPRVRASLRTQNIRLAWAQCETGESSHVLPEHIVPFLPDDTTPFYVVDNPVSFSAAFFVALLQRYRQTKELDLDSDDIYELLAVDASPRYRAYPTDHSLAKVAPYLLPVEQAQEPAFRALVATLDDNWPTDLTNGEYLALYRVFLLYHCGQDKSFAALDSSGPPPSSPLFYRPADRADRFHNQRSTPFTPNLPVPFRCRNFTEAAFTTNTPDDNDGESNEYVDNTHQFHSENSPPFIVTIAPVVYARVLAVQPDPAGKVIAGGRLLSVSNLAAWDQIGQMIYIPAHTVCVIQNLNFSFDICSCEEEANYVSRIYDCDIADFQWLQSALQARYGVPLCGGDSEQ